MVSSSLDQLVSALKHGTKALHKAKSEVASQSAPVSSSPVLPSVVAPAGSDKDELIQFMMAGVEKRFGISSSAQVERKLSRIFEPMSDGLLRAWVAQLETLPGDHSEWRSLVENLTVHETYFNRDKSTLQVLQDGILPWLITNKIKKSNKHIKIWSAGCSTGEESYNISMLLLEALCKVGEAKKLAGGEIALQKTWNIDILGTDVSSQVLRIAKGATYADFDMGSFRDLSAEQKKFFEVAEGQNDGAAQGTQYYKIKPFVSQFVRFQYHNLLSALPPEGDWDLVICRNVLIYFQDTTKREVQGVLSQALKNQGVLILGGADRLAHPELYERRFDDGVTWYIKQPA